MSYYGGTITVQGRNLITSLLAGETIEFTRILVGSGAMPEGVEPIDMTELVAPVAEAVSTIPFVDNGEMSLTVEYRNDLNGGLKEGFWLREFGIFAKTDETEEILLYYATLGDSPQPVNAYQDNRIDIRRYPVVIALALDADIQVTYNPGSFITSEEAHGLIGAMVKKAMEGVGSITVQKILIPSQGWKSVPENEQVDEHVMYIDVVCEDALAEHYPNVALEHASLQIAKNAGLSPTMEALDGVLRFWSKTAPTQDLKGTLSLVGENLNVDITVGEPGNIGGGGGNYVLPVATETVLGGVKIQSGSGLKIDGEGYLGIDAATDEEADDLYEETTGIPSSGVVIGLPVADEDTLGGVLVATDEEVEDLYEKTAGIPSSGVNHSIPAADEDTLGGVLVASDEEVEVAYEAAYDSEGDATS